MPENAEPRRWVYTLWAPVYDLFAWPFTLLRRRSIRKLSLQPGERVLIVGAGTGLDLPLLPSNLEVTAVDLTSAMLTRLRRRARRLGLKVDARMMDAQAMTFADASFDAVILHLVVSVVPDAGACLREAARVLRDGGRVVILDKFQPEGGARSVAMELISPAFNFFGTHLNRRLRPMVEASGLELAQDEPAALDGLFRIVTLDKPKMPRPETKDAGTSR